MSKLINKFKKKVVVLASVMLVLQPLLGLAVLPQKAFADSTLNLAVWNFPNNPDNATADTGSSAINATKNITAVGTSAADFDHAGATTNSARATSWMNGQDTKYWQVEFSTVGYNTIKFSSAQRSSDTGPRDFKTQYKVGAEVGWHDVTDGSTTVVNNWTTGAFANIALPTETTNQPSVYLRWIMTSNAAVDEGPMTSLGTNSIDDIAVTGVPIPPPAPVITVTNPDSAPAQTKTVTALTDTGTLTMVVNSAGVCDNSIPDADFVPYASTTFSTETDNGKTICYKADAGGGNTSYQLSTPITGIDTTAPTFTSTVTPKIAGPGVKTVDITITTDEPLKVQTSPGGGTYELMLVVDEPGGTKTTVYLNHDPSDLTGKTFTYTYTIQTIGEKTVSLTAGGSDLAGNGKEGGEPVGDFKINNIVLSPIVTAPTTSVVTAVATVPVDEQFGGGSSSDQGEVKADATIKTDDGSKADDSNQQKDEVKGKKNIPLWGIIFLLILAGIGGYLFYSQNPDKPSGRSSGKK